jgi:cytochrome b6-f complex iron-sulfur subunit
VVLSQEDSAKLLASEGSLVVEPKGAGGKIVVVHGSDGSLHAVGAACTHMGCPVEYDKGLGGFRCPCHGSEFGLDGHVIKGPATRPLKTCGVRVEDGLVTLSLPLA